MANSYSSLFYHLVFSTKLRIKMIDPEIEERVWEYVGGIAKRNGIRPIEVGGIEDHLHSLLLSPPKYSPSELNQLIKSGSSAWIKKTFGKKAFKWQDGFAAFSVSRSIVPKVVEYIKNQRIHHENMGFEEEYRELLELHEVDIIDERFLYG